MTALPKSMFELDPYAASFAKDPYATYAQMRAGGGAYYYEDIDTWMLSSMADVERVVLDPTMVRVNDAHLSAEELENQRRKRNWHDMPNHQRFVQFSLLDSEGDVHSRLRSVVFREFTPMMIAKQRDAIQAYVDRLLDTLADKRDIDFIGDFACHVPGHIIGRVLGVPDEDCDKLRFWSEEVVRFFDIGRNDDDKRRAEQATTEFYEYLVDLLAQRRAAPQPDLLSRLVEHQAQGTLTEDELISTAMLILMAGHGSTIDVLGSGMHALMKFPDQHDLLRGDPGLIKTGVQEMFRYEPPLPFFHRFATEDCEVAGQTFAAGTRFGLLYGAANRDPARFEAPDTFDVTRNPNRHVAFGGGVHFCLGNHLARLDMDVIFTTLNQRFRNIELLDEPTYKPGLAVRGPKALHLRLTPN